MTNDTPEPNHLLREAREMRGWSRQKVATELSRLFPGVAVTEKEVARWERGKRTPSPYYREKLCALFDATADALGFLRKTEATTRSLIASSELIVPGQHELLPEEFLCTDLEFRVQCMIYEALSRRIRLDDLRRKLANALATERSMTMDPERRKLLRQLALTPIQALGLSALGASRTIVPEDTLIHCAAGITACEHLSKGADLHLAYTITRAYIPTLKGIARNSPSHRKTASELTAQAMLLLAALGLHLEGTKAAIGYAEQSVTYSEISGNAELILTSLGQLAWIFSCDKQYQKALEKAQLAEHLLKSTKAPVHPLIQSNTYAVVGAYSAQTGHRDEALTALSKATQTFLSTTPTDELSYADYDYSEIALTWGLAHARTGHPEEALNSFAEVIDPTTLQTKIPVSERARIEFLNHMALALVKSPTKDMEQTIAYWQAGIQGAKVLQSEQRFNEAATAYEIMESIWSGERRITPLRELVAHW